MIFDPNNGKVLRWNKAFKNVIGYSDKEIETMITPEMFYGQEDVNKAQEAIKNILNGQEAKIELNLKRKDEIMTILEQYKDL